MVNAVVSFMYISSTKVGAPATTIVEFYNMTCRINGVATTDTILKPKVVIRDLKVATKYFNHAALESLG
jgi:hypothetical protein